VEAASSRLSSHEQTATPVCGMRGRRARPCVGILQDHSSGNVHHDRLACRRRRSPSQGLTVHRVLRWIATVFHCNGGMIEGQWIRMELPSTSSLKTSIVCQFFSFSPCCLDIEVEDRGSSWDYGPRSGARRWTVARQPIKAARSPQSRSKTGPYWFTRSFVHARVIRTHVVRTQSCGLQTHDVVEYQEGDEPE